MDAVTPQGQEKGHNTADTHSHLVRPHEMEWQKTRFAGCEAKTLLFDRTTGLMTALGQFRASTRAVARSPFAPKNGHHELSKGGQNRTPVLSTLDGS